MTFRGLRSLAASCALAIASFGLTTVAQTSPATPDQEQAQQYLEKPGKQIARKESQPAETVFKNIQPVTLADPGGSRYSPLTVIDRGNVGNLKVAWTYRHGDYRDASGPDRYHRGSAFESTPVLAQGRLIFTTPFNRVIALNPETGAELWTFDPKIDKNRRFANMLINRGVAQWRGERVYSPRWMPG